MGLFFSKKVSNKDKTYYTEYLGTTYMGVSFFSSSSILSPFSYYGLPFSYAFLGA